MANELTISTQSPLAANFAQLIEYKKDLTEAECLDVIAALDADSNAAGVDKATSAAKTILSIYRVNFDDPRAYVAGVVAVLSEYPAGVLRRIADPRSGIARQSKFLPTIAEISDACDGQMELRLSARRNAGFTIWRHRIAGLSESDPARLRILEESMTAVGLCREGDRWKLIPRDKDDDDELSIEDRNRRKHNRERIAGLISSIGQAAA